MEETIKTLRKTIRAARAQAALLPRSREASIVATKLDEAALWADATSGDFGAEIDTLK